jgi:hypothetical protein
VRKMRWGRVLVLVLAGLVGLGIGLVVAEPWDGPTSVDALELDEAWREEDADAGMRNVDDDDGTGNGARNDVGATDDGRDGTRDGDTRDGGGGTGTGDSAVGSAGIVNAATDDGGAANGGATDDGATAASASGGGDT